MCNEERTHHFLLHSGCNYSTGRSYFLLNPRSIMDSVEQVRSKVLVMSIVVILRFCTTTTT